MAACFHSLLVAVLQQRSRVFHECVEHRSLHRVGRSGFCSGRLCGDDKWILILHEQCLLQRPGGLRIADRRYRSWGDNGIYTIDTDRTIAFGHGTSSILELPFARSVISIFVSKILYYTHAVHYLFFFILSKPNRKRITPTNPNPQSLLSFT